MNTFARLASAGQSDVDGYREVRSRLPELARGLSAEDLALQSMPDASPGKWHLAHTTWFFETMLLEGRPGYEPVDPRWRRLFNSYYVALGERTPRDRRALMTRPGLAEVMAYRAEIDRRMIERLSDGLTSGRDRYLLALGLHHEQQHQELFLTDILHLMSCSPLDPAAYAAAPAVEPGAGSGGGFLELGGGRVEIGAAGDHFAFDNEGPRHAVLVPPFRLAANVVSAGDWIAFIDAGGYRRPEFWLSDGWACACSEGWTAPLYWRCEDGVWKTQSLTGVRAVDPAEPVRHISYYEADAFARWCGARLPTEAEWEHAATTEPGLADAHGALWQWTSSAYSPYPGFRPTEGTASEYNGKFMANQMVLRGSSFATPPGHARDTYRNFFYPHQRWAFMGLRLASDGAPERRRSADSDPFAEALIEGLSRPQKAVSPKWFYDAEGSRLFEEITRLPEYYPTRQETALLRDLAPRLAAAFGPDATLVEFGSGASEKTRILLDAAPDLAAYVPIDISAEALAEAAGRIAAAYPRLRVEPMVGDFLHLEGLPEGIGQGRRIGFFPGSTIGNLSPEEAVAFLKGARRLLGEGALFILGVDLIKDPATLVAAYDDARGVTAAFNRNLLARANRELGADFDLDGFSHRAVWNPDDSRMEMHLVAGRDQTVRIAGRPIHFREGETIHTESSRKFSEESVRRMAGEAGWALKQVFVGPPPAVALVTLSN